MGSASRGHHQNQEVVTVAKLDKVKYSIGKINQNIHDKDANF